MVFFQKENITFVFTEKYSCVSTANSMIRLRDRLKKQDVQKKVGEGRLHMRKEIQENVR